MANVSRLLFIALKQADDNRKETETILEKAKRKSSEMYESAKNIGSKAIRATKNKASDIGSKFVTKSPNTGGLLGKQKRSLTSLGKGSLIGGGILAAGAGGRYLYNRNK